MQALIKVGPYLFFIVILKLIKKSRILNPHRQSFPKFLTFQSWRSLKLSFWHGMAMLASSLPAHQTLGQGSTHPPPSPFRHYR